MSLNVFDMNSNVEELMHYQRRRDLRTQAACEHITPVTALKERVKKMFKINQLITIIMLNLMYNML